MAASHRCPDDLSRRMAVPIDYSRASRLWAWQSCEGIACSAGAQFKEHGAGGKPRGTVASRQAVHLSVASIAIASRTRRMWSSMAAVISCTCLGEA